MPDLAVQTDPTVLIVALFNSTSVAISETGPAVGTVPSPEPSLRLAGTSTSSTPTGSQFSRVGRLIG